jgi:hypothetical protein
MSQEQPASEKEARPDNDLPPTGDEARAQRVQTAMPLVWAVLGLLVVLVFVLVLAGRRGPPTSNARVVSSPAAAAGPAGSPTAR